MDWKDKVIELRSQGLTWNEITDEIKSEFPKLTFNQIHEKARNYYRFTKDARLKEENTSSDNTVSEPSTKSVEYKSDGSVTFEGIIRLMDGEPITPEIIMKAHNLDSEKWDVLSYKSNFWQAQKKGGSTLHLYQSKITVRPKSKQEITFEDIDRYFDGKDYSKDKLPIDCFDYDPDGEILDVKLPDLHIGLLSWHEETSEDYDLKIAKQRYFMCINDIVRKCQGRKFKKVMFITLGDILHVDNEQGTTTKGTQQQMDGRLAKITECAENMLIDGITLLGKIAPVEYIYLAGNHDRVCGYMLARSVSNVFLKDLNVTCDISPNPIKYRRYGVGLALYHHGDAPKKNLAELPEKFARKEISASKFIEINMGHQHEEEIKHINGYRIRYFPVLSASSYWEHQQAYSTDTKAIVCDIRNEKTGLRETWYTMI
jgi:UDP-2,3-diacylglucosamine pyrophosphatase LpxH